MLFNSLNFVLFLPVVFALYWLSARKLVFQNIILLVASYFFYACWDWRFLFLLVFSTLLDFYTAIKIYESGERHVKRFWFWLSISVNIGFLCIFKYLNFFTQSFADGLDLLGFEVNPTTLNIILPVGISFYTFHGLSYVIDIYKDRIKPEFNFVNYSLFVSFFPLLVAGPIERATHLLPQIQRKRNFSYSDSVDGLRQILWGLFKKVAIADNCAPFVNAIFDDGSNYNGSTYLIGALLFTFQIYCDFSGYSDIALGVSRLFGIELLRNFAYPYFSRDIAEFWRKWHISLSSWFRDYVYIPLGGSKGGKLFRIRNTFVIFILSGFWHGANWTFLFWGFLNAVYFLPLLLSDRNRANTDIVAAGRLVPRIKDVINISCTFFLTVIAWVFFRSPTMGSAIQFLKRMFSLTLWKQPEIFPVTVIVLVAILLSAEWIQREKHHALDFRCIPMPAVLRWCIYMVSIAIIVFYGGTQQEFIYFQF